MARTIAISSGKGGVGKTIVSLNLALELARLGHRTCLFDADFGLANINILLGLSPKYDIKDVILGNKGIDEIMLKDVQGVDILPGSSGVEEMASLRHHLGPEQMKGMLDTFSTLEKYDFIIFDTAAGISKNVLSFCLAAGEVVLVVTHEPTSLTDAYGLLKVLVANGFSGKAKLVVNRCKDANHARSTFQIFKNTVSEHLHMELTALGLIFQDEKMDQAVRRQQPFLSLFPTSYVAQCFNRIALRLLEAPETPPPGLASFWNHCLGVMTNPVKMPAGSNKQGSGEEGSSAEPDRVADNLMSAGVAQEICMLRHTLEDIAGKMGGALPAGAVKDNGAQITGPVVKLDLDELLTNSPQAE